MSAVDTTWDILRETLLLAWAATALFCGLAAAAAAAWGGRNRTVAFVVGALTLYLGLALVVALAAVRAGNRRTAVLQPAPYPASPPPPGPPSGAALTYEAPAAPTAWQRWTRTPPTRADLTVAAVATVLAIAWLATLGVSWLKVSAVGRGVAALGAFEVQFGLFVVLTALALLVCAAGVLRWRSAWWPVLLAWFATWWALVVVLAHRAAGERLEQLSRLLRDQARDRLGYDVRPAIDLGAAWTFVAVLAVATLALSVALIVLRPTPLLRPAVPAA